jgi:hypothetical protein
MIQRWAYIFGRSRRLNHSCIKLCISRRSPLGERGNKPLRLCETIQSEKSDTGQPPDVDYLVLYNSSSSRYI